jgi:hypothetical protein
MERTIRLEFANPHHRLFPGIYKITLGGKFYIGKANVPAERIKVHENSLNRALQVFYERRFEDIPKAQYANYLKYKKWVKYLHENPKVNVGRVEIIQRGIHPISLYYMENRHLNAIKDHPDSLNAIFTSPRPNADDHHYCDAKITQNQLLLFNPLNGASIFANSISKTYSELKKRMNASLDPTTYRKYIAGIMNREYQEAAEYLTTEQKTERLRRISDYLRGV